MSSIAILSTDTPHHRYFINVLLDGGVPLQGCVFETEYVQAPFATGPLFEEEEKAFEEGSFFENVSKELDRVAIHEVANINTPDGLEAIRSMAPTFAIVFGTRKLSPNVIDLFPNGLINVHRGIAQYYRGLDSDLWAIYHRDYGNIGVTIHKVDKELDTGAIAAQKRLVLDKTIRTHQLRYHTTVIAAELTLDAARQYLDGCLVSAVQERVGRYYSFMPLSLKKIVRARFDKYCEGLDA